MRLVLIFALVQLLDFVTVSSLEQFPKLWAGPGSGSGFSQTIKKEQFTTSVREPVLNDGECGVQKYGRRYKRIIGGNSAAIGEFPWQVHIKIGGAQCGGALLNHYYLVTAAHCVRNAKLSDITVYLGEHDTKVNGAWGDPFREESFTVIDRKLHPEFIYKPGQPFRFDVAVLRLDRKVRFRDHISPICLPESEGNNTLLGQDGIVAGWGKTDNSIGKSKVNILRKATLPIISNMECRKWYQSKNIGVQLYDEMFCAGHENGDMDTCRGDSGCPLVVLERRGWTLVGITSFGFGCGVDHQPGIYHRVSASIKWILEQISSSKY